jgi:hypothetical protein
MIPKKKVIINLKRNRTRVLELIPEFKAKNSELCFSPMFSFVYYFINRYISFIP